MPSRHWLSDLLSLEVSGDGPLVDTGLELDGERRLYVCAECITGPARTPASAARRRLRHEFEAEIAERDARLSALAGQLTAAEKTIKEQREEIAGRGEALDRARVSASRAVGELQQIA